MNPNILTDKATREFTITRTFDAPRATVYAAWTDPDQMAHWMCPAGLTVPRDRVSADVRVGGSYSSVMVESDGTEHPTRGEYTEVVPPERLAFTWADPTDATSYSVCTVSLAEDGPSRTTMTFRLVAPGPISPEDGARAGWGSCFDNLASTLAS